MMAMDDYHQRIIDYYRDTENAYKDSWDLGRSLAIHYGYWDEQVRSFGESLIRMNEVMKEAAGISASDRVLDAGCGVGGSAIYLAANCGCQVTGITLSERQVTQALLHARERKVDQLATFLVNDYCATDFPDSSFDVVWGCESICYAANKENFIAEAFRLLKPGGRLVVADGFVTEFQYNEHPVIRRWLDGWQVDHLETPGRFCGFMEQKGFDHVRYRDITRETAHSSRRLNRFYYLASLYLIWKKFNFSRPATDMQKKNIAACRYQYLGRKKGLWQYGLITGIRP